MTDNEVLTERTSTRGPRPRRADEYVIVMADCDHCVLAAHSDPAFTERIAGLVPGTVSRLAVGRERFQEFAPCAPCYARYLGEIRDAAKVALEEWYARQSPTTGQAATR